jgi:hypothetical protein
LETAQLLCSAHHVTGGTAQYKLSHKNHPCSIWVRSSLSNYLYLCELGLALGEEYTHRYGKIHSTYTKLKDVLKLNPINIPNIPFKDPPPAMSHFPLCIVPNNSLYSYYNYYIVAKNYFAKWTNRPIPEWYSTGLSTKKLYA